MCAEGGGNAKMVVRGAVDTDIPLIIGLWHAMRLEAGLGDDLLVPEWEARLGDFLRAGLATGTVAVWLAELRGTRAGTTLGVCKDDYPFLLFAPGFYAFIGCVFTAPPFRGRGIATELVRRALNWARERGAREVRLLPTPASQPIYERLGFRPAGDLALSLE